MELAEKLGNLITSGVLASDEKGVRGDVFCRLRELKEKHGAHLSWETLRRVVVRLYPPLRNDLSSWRTLRMACQRAQPSQPGVYTIGLSYKKGRGLIPRRKPAEPIPIASPADSVEAMRKFRERQDIRLLGRRLFNLRQKLFTSMRWSNLDSLDARILGLASEFLNEAVRRRAEGGRNAHLIRRCEQLLRLARPADVGPEDEA